MARDRAPYSVVFLDAGPLGDLVHPRREIREEPFQWFVGLQASGVRVVVPEIADYELRRKLLHIDSTRSVERLDELEAEATYLPLTTPVMRRASRLWAEARQRGEATAAPDDLDGDVILAAQALIVEEQAGESVVVATGNEGHLKQFIAAYDWHEIGPAIAGDEKDDGQ